jgi:hypothetical protein
MIETLDFSGNIVTVIGFVGVVSTFVILVTVFRSYYNSPLRK